MPGSAKKFAVSGPVVMKHSRRRLARRYKNSATAVVDKLCIACWCENGVGGGGGAERSREIVATTIFPSNEAGSCSPYWTPDRPFVSSAPSGFTFAAERVPGRSTRRGFIRHDEDHVASCSTEETQSLALELLDERLHRYRLAQPKLEQSMAQSLERYGQLSPIVICVHEDDCVLIDNFYQTLECRARLKGITHLTARVGWRSMSKGPRRRSTT